MEINSVLNQMRLMAAQARNEGVQPAVNNNAGVSFGDTMKSAVSQVNDLQMKTGELQKAFEAGDKNISVAQVMLASQKSGVAFQATLQVRNKFIEAYKEIMNMPI